MSNECKIMLWGKSYVVTAQDESERLRIEKAAEMLNEEIESVSRTLKTARDSQVVLFAALHALNKALSSTHPASNDEYLKELNELASEVEALSGIDSQKF